MRRGTTQFSEAIYAISEIFGPTIQGEGRHAGWPCYFIRFHGCNYWPSADAPSRVCPFCDTPQLHKREDMSLKDIVARLDSHRHGYGLVITGGEPCLQLDDMFLSAVLPLFSWCDVETNGSIPFKFSRRANLFISASPKTESAITNGQTPDWYKLVYPAKKDLLSVLRTVARGQGVPVYIQPEEPRPFTDAGYRSTIKECVDLVLANPELRLSIQQHKVLHLP